MNIKNQETVKKALAELSQTEASRKVLSEAIVEWVKPNHLASDLISLFLNTRTLKEGDFLVKKLREPNIRVRKMVPGTIHLADEITVDDRVNYTLDNHIVKVAMSQWDLERGELGSLQEIRKEMISSLIDFFAGRVFASLSTVWNSTNTPNNYTEVSGDLTKSALDDAIDRINYRTGGVKSIVSVRNNLLPITEFAGYGTYDSTGQFSDEILTESLREGWIGQYRGVDNIVGLRQQWNNPKDDEAMLPEDYVLVIGHNAGEFITYGEPRWKEYTDNEPTPPNFTLEVYQQWGMIVDKAEGIYVIKLT
jgi:hypothetical protein